RFTLHLPDGIYDSDIARFSSYGFEHAFYIPDEAHLDPQQAMKALLQVIVKEGGVLMAIRAAPDALAKTHDYVVDCRGVGAADEGDTLRGVKGGIIFVRNTEFQAHSPIRMMHPRYPLYIVPRADHIFMIGASVIESSDHSGVMLRSAM